MLVTCFLTMLKRVSDEMMEVENETLRERVAALEQKAHAQADELVCLRSTLADVLRRVAALEHAHAQSAPVVPMRHASSPAMQQHAAAARNGAIRGRFHPDRIIITLIYI